MGHENEFKYFYGNEADTYSFYRIPDCTFHTKIIDKTVRLWYSYMIKVS